MEDLLYLVHRIPYPPRKGDKVRSFHFLKHLARHYRIHLGTFIDDPADWQHIETVREMCASAMFAPLRPRIARLLSTRALFSAQPMTLPYFASRKLGRWVREHLRSANPQRVLVFSSSMAQYVPEDLGTGARSVLDFVDVDSQKWTSYGEAHGGAVGALYRREGRRLLAYERASAARFGASVFVTRAESELFKVQAPECAPRTTWVGNGVDAEFFTPDKAGPDPYGQQGPVVVFTGAMDYKANVDAVRWFVGQVWPRISADHHTARFFIVGANPTQAVRKLGEVPGVTVTGTVHDVRPYLAHASVAVAPLLVARGVQNKVLEAMAMGRPVVCSSGAMEGIDAGHGLEHHVVDGAEEFARSVENLIAEPARATELGRHARDFVRGRYDWAASADRLVALLERERARVSEPPLIAHVIHRLGIGGLENGLVNLINHLPRGAWRHAVVCMTDATDFRSRIQRPDVEVHEMHKREGQDPMVLVRLWRLFRSLRPRIVHTRNISALEAQLSAVCAGVKVRVHGEHGRDSYDLRGDNAKHLLLRRLIAPLVTCFVPMSRDLEQWLAHRVGVPAAKIVQLYNGVDAQRFRPIEGGRDTWPEPQLRDPALFVIGAGGRLQSVKDPLNLCRAFIHLRQQVPGELASRLRLVYLGDGPLLEEMRALLLEHGALSACWLPGAREDMAELMPGFDVFALPSLGEGISNTVLEAMACALPVVATDVGGNRELVVAETGALVPAADFEALALALSVFARDPEKARQYGRAGRRRVETLFALPAMVDRYHSLYFRLVPSPEISSN